MATKLTKIVKREIASSDRKGRALIVSIEPGDILSFRPKGAKRSVSVYLGCAFMLAQLATIGREYDEAMKKYQADRSIGRRRRRPNKRTVPYGKIYFDALK